MDRRLQRKVWACALIAVFFAGTGAVLARTGPPPVGPSGAKRDSSPAAKKHFIYLIRPVRAGFLATIMPEERAVMKEHGLYLRKMLEEKSLILAGPCADTTFGVVLFEAESMEEARRVMENDPAVKEGVMSAELHPFNLSLFQSGYERKK